MVRLRVIVDIVPALRMRIEAGVNALLGNALGL